MFEIFTGVDSNLKSIQRNVTKFWFLALEVEVKIDQNFLKIFKTLQNHAGLIQRHPLTCKGHKTMKICTLVSKYNTYF